MDLQTLFDIVAKHLLMQKKRAMVEELDKAPKLMYITPDGLKDAIGCLIWPNLYDPEMEGYAFKGKDTWGQYAPNDGLKKLRKALLSSGVPVNDEAAMRLLTDLQHVHDNNAPELWEPRLRAVARTWRLSDHMVDTMLQQRVSPRRPTIDEILSERIRRTR